MPPLLAVDRLGRRRSFRRLFALTDTRSGNLSNRITIVPPASSATTLVWVTPIQGSLQYRSSCSCVGYVGAHQRLVADYFCTEVFPIFARAPNFSRFGQWRGRAVYVPKMYRCDLNEVFDVVCANTLHWQAGARRGGAQLATRGPPIRHTVSIDISSTTPSLEPSTELNSFKFPHAICCTGFCSCLVCLPSLPQWLDRASSFSTTSRKTTTPFESRASPSYHPRRRLADLRSSWRVLKRVHVWDLYHQPATRWTVTARAPPWTIGSAPTKTSRAS